MMDLRASGPKRNHKKGIAAQRLEAKRASAKARQESYDKLTVDEKIAKLDMGGFVAAKQRNRLAYSKILSEVKKRV